MNKLIFDRPKFDKMTADCQNTIFVPIFKDKSDYVNLHDEIGKCLDEHLRINEANCEIPAEFSKDIKNVLERHSIHALNRPSMPANIDFRASLPSNINSLSQDSTDYSEKGPSNIKHARPISRRMIFNSLPDEPIKKSPLNTDVLEKTSHAYNTNCPPQFLTRLTLIKEWVKTREMIKQLPCYFSEYPASDELIIFFHANAEDITKVDPLCKYFREHFKKSVLAMEYSGYSFYTASKTKPKIIKSDAEKLVEFVTIGLGIPTSKITIIGRSIGSGPSLYLSSKFRFKMVIIVSGLLSIRKVVKDRFGILSLFVGKYFDNLKFVSENKSPTLFIHGKNDEMILCKHSLKLQKSNKSFSKIILHNDMPHNKFSIVKAVCVPALEFEREICGKSNINVSGSLKCVRFIFRTGQ